MWCDAYQRRLLALLNSTAAMSTVRAMLFGHTHRDHFALADDHAFLVAPSVSPNTMTNPTFRVAYADRSSYNVSVV